MFEWLFSKKSHENRSTGSKMREIRLRKGISSSDLGAKCKITDSAVRHYEGDLRSPKEDKLQEIANALGVDVSALYDRKIESISDIMHILFEIEANGYIVPTEFPTDSFNKPKGLGVRTTNEVLSEAMEKWLEKRVLWETEQISDDDYRNWQDAFPQEYEVEVHPEDKSYPEQSTIFDYRVHILDFLKKLRIVMMYDTEQVEYTIEKDRAKNTADTFRILKMNLFTWLDREIDRMEQEPLIANAPINRCILDSSDKPKK